MADLEIILKAKDQASSVLGKVGGALGALGTAGLAVAGAGLAAMGAGLVASISAAAEAEQVQAQLNAVLKATSGAAGVTADAANELAASLAQMTTFEDDLILQTENMLLTFTNIGADVFPATTQAALDMATALGGDPVNMAMMLGKAMNDLSGGGLAALRRNGIQFSEEQEVMIQRLFETGQVAQAQQMILAELNKEFGGSAAAAASTFSGRMAQLKNQLGEAGETIGQAFLPLLTSLAQQALPMVAQGLAIIQPPLNAFVMGLESLAAGNGFVTSLATTLLSLGVSGETIARLSNMLIQFSTDLNASLGPASLLIEDAWNRIAIVFGGATGNVTALDIGFMALQGTLNAIVIGVQAVALGAQGVAFVFESVNTAVQTAIGLFNQLTTIWGSLDPTLKGAISGGASLVAAPVSAVQSVASGNLPGGGDVTGLLQGIQNAILGQTPGPVTVNIDSQPLVNIVSSKIGSQVAGYKAMGRPSKLQ
jgi:hypothetical protein